MGAKNKLKRSSSSVDAPYRLIWKRTFTFELHYSLDVAVSRLQNASLDGQIALDTRSHNLKQCNSVIFVHKSEPIPGGRWLITTLREKSGGGVTVENISGLNVMRLIYPVFTVLISVLILILVYPPFVPIAIIFFMYNVFATRYWVIQDVTRLHDEVQKALISPT